ncbi:heterokaryon incompatibility protein-domain-containing protein, partial [Lasiosphaeria ovina]
RIGEWIKACEASHDSCNEESQTAEGLFGHGPFALRLIDVENRMLVQSLTPVRYLTLSYVWGPSANRRFAMVDYPYPHHEDAWRFPEGIKPLEKQPVEMMFGRVGRTFEDLISFARRLRERYIWIDAMCIPQDEPAVLASQISRMDQIYFHGACNIVSLSSGVDDGLPGTSPVSDRNTQQLVELLPNGARVATPLIELDMWMPYAPWTTRGWTLQEHLLARRSVFFGRHEAFFVC